MTRVDASGAVLVEPAYCAVPEHAYTLGPEVADLCRLANFAPDPEQDIILDGVFAKDAAGRRVARTVGVVAARQNIKTGALKQCALGWMFVEDVPHIVWSAHEWDTVAGAFHDLDELIGGSDYLRRRVRSVQRGERDQQFLLKSGVRMEFRTRTKGGGAGLSAPKVVLDEGWKLIPDHVSALLPLISAQVDGQVLYASSAAHPESEVLRRLVARGRAAVEHPGRDRSIFYAEWCAPPPAVACARGDACGHELDTPGCGCDKPEYWQQANSQYGRRIEHEAIAEDRLNMLPAVFGRERMGWHDPGEDDGTVIPVVEWAASIDEASEPAGVVCLSVVFASDRKSAAIGLVGRRGDGLWHVEIADRRAGTGWVVGRAREIAARNDPDNPEATGTHPVITVAVDENSHEATIIDDLEAPWVDEDRQEHPGLDVMRLTGREVALAYGMFYDAVTDDEATGLRHRNQDVLTLALAGATTRDIGDAGKAWGRKKSGVDIAPLVTVTQAMYAHAVKAPLAESEPGAWVI